MKVHPNKSLAAIAAAILFCTTMPAKAVVYCAETAAQFQAALLEAGTNGENDRILLASPQLSSPSGGYHYASTAEGELLWIEGGFGSQCSTRPTGAKTVVDGAGSTGAGALIIEADSSIVIVQDLVFVNFAAAFSAAAALFIDGDDLNLTVEGIGAYANSGASRSAISITGANGLLRFRDNIIAGNRSNGSVVLIRGRSSMPGQEFGKCIITNNTHVANNANDAMSGGTFDVANCAETIIASNIFWENQGIDLRVNAFERPVSLRSNDIESIAFGLQIELDEQGTVAIDPEFEPGLLNFTPSHASPLVDAGDPQARFEGDPNDHRGRARVSGTAVDIGAVERQTDVFRNSFED